MNSYCLWFINLCQLLLYRVNLYLSNTNSQQHFIRTHPSSVSLHPGADAVHDELEGPAQQRLTQLHLPADRHNRQVRTEEEQHDDLVSTEAANQQLRQEVLKLLLTDARLSLAMQHLWWNIIIYLHLLIVILKKQEPVKPGDAP